MAKTIKIIKVNPFSIGNYVGTFYALIGVVVGLIITFGSTFVTMFGPDGFAFFKGLGMGLSVGFLSLFVYPVLYFLIGWIQGAIFGLIFNAVTHYMGGIELETT